MSLPKATLAEIKQLFEGLPEGRSNRNHYNFSTEQALGVHKLRAYKTPREIEAILDISVYRIHKLELYARTLEKRAKQANATN